MEQLPPGFRFYPTEEELISFYLHNKLHSHKPELDRVIPSIDIYNFEPSQLPEQASQISHKDNEQWFFFMPQQEREARGGRPTRTTATGYWKATGSRSYVYSSSNKVIGVKKTMVFYQGKAPTGTKTKWKMNEYTALDHESNVIFDPNTSLSTSTIPKLRHELSLCRIYITSGCARAFDRRPPETTTTKTTTSTRTLNDNIVGACDYNLQRDDMGQGSGTNVDTQNEENGPNNTMLLDEKSSSSTDERSNPREDCWVATMQGNNNITYDIEMTQSLDTLIDLDQLGWL